MKLFLTVLEAFRASSHFLTPEVAPAQRPYAYVCVS